MPPSLRRLALPQPPAQKPPEKKELIRRSAIEAKKVEEGQESRRIKEEAEWEIPAFLRRVKFKS